MVSELMDPNNAYPKSHHSQQSGGWGWSGPHRLSLSWKGLVPGGSLLPKAEFELAIVPRDPLAEVGHRPDSRMKRTKALDPAEAGGGLTRPVTRQPVLRSPLPLSSMVPLIKKVIFFESKMVCEIKSP